MADTRRTGGRGTPRDRPGAGRRAGDPRGVGRDPGRGRPLRRAEGQRLLLPELLNGAVRWSPSGDTGACSSWRRASSSRWPSIDLLLRATWGSTRAHRDRLHLATWDVDGTGGAVAGIVAERRGAAGAGPEIGVILGLSTAEAGIDPKILDEMEPGRLRWADLYGYGGGFEKLAEMARLLAYCEPRPAVVLIAVNPPHARRSGGRSATRGRRPRSGPRWRRRPRGGGSSTP